MHGIRSAIFKRWFSHSQDSILSLMAPSTREPSFPIKPSEVSTIHSVFPTENRNKRLYTKLTDNATSLTIAQENATMCVWKTLGDPSSGRITRYKSNGDCMSATCKYSYKYKEPSGSEPGKECSGEDELKRKRESSSERDDSNETPAMKKTTKEKTSTDKK